LKVNRHCPPFRSWPQRQLARVKDDLKIVAKKLGLKDGWAWELPAEHVRRWDDAA
jgi:hypothetical protein